MFSLDFSVNKERIDVIFSINSKEKFVSIHYSSHGETNPIYIYLTYGIMDSSAFGLLT